MIVVDASAIVAVLGREPDADAIAAKLDRIASDMRSRFASTVTIWEASIAVARLWSVERPIGLREVNAFLNAAGIKVIVPDEAITALAVAAAERYGRGPGYPGILNLGACFSYATAKHLGAALLFKGDDFSRTDIVAA